MRRSPRCRVRDSAPLGAPCRVDVFSTDPAKTQAFYSGLFGWTVEDPGPDYGGYFNFLKDGVQVVGGMRNDGEVGIPDHWSVYLATADAEATAASAAANGGQVIVAAMAVMELGSMAVMTDPGNATIGAWQPGLHKGFGIIADPAGAGVVEARAHDYKPSIAFYETVFGWDTRTMADDRGVPLHDARRGRRCARRGHGPERLSARGISGRVVGLLPGRGHRRRPCARRWRSSAERS